MASDPTGRRYVSMNFFASRRALSIIVVFIIACLALIQLSSLRPGFGALTGEPIRPPPPDDGHPGHGQFDEKPKFGGGPGSGPPEPGHDDPGHLEPEHHEPEAPKPEQPKPEQPKPSPPTPEEHKPDPPKPEQPKPEHPESEHPTDDKPKDDKPKDETTKGDKPKDEPKTRPLALPEDPLIHGVHVSQMKHPKYELSDFTEAPMLNPPAQRRRNPWLATVICSAGDVDRRMMIRTTWMRIFEDVPFDARFVISNPGEAWAETVRYENQTFGDMIVLDHLHEDDLTANTVKTLELLRWLVAKGHEYEFVSKVDTDLWLDAKSFWDEYLAPRLSHDDGVYRATVSETIIGQLYYSPPHKITFPHGSMYTYTWDLVKLFPTLQDKYKVVAGEDLAVAMLLGKAGRKVNLVNMPGDEKFDYNPKDAREDGSPWAKDGSHATDAAHALGQRAMAIHQLKDKNLFMTVAKLFTGDGMVVMPNPPPADGPKPKYGDSQLGHIAEDFWGKEDDVWVCNHLWIMGKNKSGFQEVAP